MSYGAQRRAPTAGGRHSGDAEGVFNNNPSPAMNSIIYIVGLVVVIVAVLSFFGLR